MSTALPREFYARNTIQVARDLLGKIVSVTDAKGRVAAGRIVETEAYRGDDPASHSGRGETPRSKLMFGEAGVAYVYFIYGMYEMLNFVTEKAGFPGAVLIRALEPVLGEELMWERRKGASRLTARQLTNGPGRLCRALDVRLADNGAPLTGPRFRVYDDGMKVRRSSVLESPRVGITQAADRPWRYFLDSSRFVSQAPQNALARPARPLREVIR